MARSSDPDSQRAPVAQAPDATQAIGSCCLYCVSWLLQLCCSCCCRELALSHVYEVALTLSVPPYFLPIDTPYPSVFLSNLSAFLTDSDCKGVFKLAAAMPPRKSAHEFFHKGREKGSTQCTEGIDGSTVLKEPTKKVLKNTIA